jgi:formamidopyrimidine-DNA glycosylase
VPELPEVETVKIGIKKLCGSTINNVIIRNDSLRYKIIANLGQILHNKQLKEITRRAKYLILHLNSGYLIIHLGMTGSISLIDLNTVAAKISYTKHDHLDIIFNSHILRYNDPRRFGCIIYTDDYMTHPLIKNLGVEPLDKIFNPEYLFKRLRKSAIKPLIMNNHIVVGVGNIYASEALFKAKISPLRQSNTLSLAECQSLVKCIKKILIQAIKLGGSTLRDYKQTDGSLGYFQNSHKVYNKADKPCEVCNSIILEKRLGQRNSFYCPNCQK